MLASPKREGNLWPASVSLFNLECVVTKIGYNQTRVCRRIACPCGASDIVSPRAHMNLYRPPSTHTDCYHLPACNRRLQFRLTVPSADYPRHYYRIVILRQWTQVPGLRISL